MIRGEIGNTDAPRFIITWDVLGSLPDSARKQESMSRRLHRWEKAVWCWEIDREIDNRMYRAVSRYGIRWELAVFDRPRDFCRALAQRLDEEDISVAAVNPYLSPLALAGSLAYRHDLLAVVDIPERFAHYGSRTLDPRSL